MNDEKGEKYKFAYEQNWNLLLLSSKPIFVFRIAIMKKKVIIVLHFLVQ